MISINNKKIDGSDTGYNKININGKEKKSLKINNNSKYLKCIFYIYFYGGDKIDGFIQIFPSFENFTDINIGGKIKNFEYNSLKFIKTSECNYKNNKIQYSFNYHPDLKNWTSIDVSDSAFIRKCFLNLDKEFYLSLGSYNNEDVIRIYINDITVNNKKAKFFTDRIGFCYTTSIFSKAETENSLVKITNFEYF